MAFSPVSDIPQVAIHRASASPGRTPAAEFAASECPVKIDHDHEDQGNAIAVDGSSKTRGGWRSMPYILLNELVERFAAVGFTLNFITYLMGEYGMGQVQAASLISAVSGTASLTPLLGAFLSDVYLGRFYSIILGSLANLMASILFIITTTSPSLRPEIHQQASNGQFSFLVFALVFTTIASGFLRPCTYAFGADQFGQVGTIKEIKEQTQSFFNWYFFSLYVASLAGATILVYIQDNAGWVWGFSMSGGSVIIAILLLVVGSQTFRYAPLSGSPYTSFAQVIVAATHKRKKLLPLEDGKLYHGKEIFDDDLAHTKRIRWLDHAAIVGDEDLDAEGNVRNPYRLCRVSQVEQLKAVIALAPLWLVNLLSTTVVSPHGAFNVPQAKIMDRHVGHSAFQVPPASMMVFAYLALLTWMPLYDRVVVPALRRATGRPGGITTLQRVGAGFALSTLALTVAGLVESERRRRAVASHGTLSMSVFWLAPQYCLHGLADSFHLVGQLEFLYDQLPENMRNTAGALFWCSSGIGHYGGIVLIQLVHKYSAIPSHVDWLADDLNQGHLDYFFFLLAILQVVVFFVFLLVARQYKYN